MKRVGLAVSALILLVLGSLLVTKHMLGWTQRIELHMDHGYIFVANPGRTVYLGFSYSPNGLDFGISP